MTSSDYDRAAMLVAVRKKTAACLTAWVHRPRDTPPMLAGEWVAMRETVSEDIKRWTARRRSARVIKIMQGKTTAAAESRACDPAPSEIERWVKEAR